MVHITQHAFDRYRERIANHTDEQITAALNTPLMRAAIAWGATAVKLSTGQKAVLCGGKIVTIIPAPTKRGKVGKHIKGRRTE